MKRRGFVKLCASAVAGMAASPELLAERSEHYHRYARVALFDTVAEKPVNASELEVGETYLFHYPYVSTPCFLMDLGKPVTAKKTLKTENGARYRWRGGIGPGKSVVAFSAICAHRMSHPAPSVSFINYRHENARFKNSKEEIEQRAGVIYCCSEKSVYDPASGCQVLGGPAPQPLAAIELEYDEADDTFFATGTLGGEMFDKYFKTFHDRLVLQYARTDIDAPVQAYSHLMPLGDYCKNLINCQA